MTLVGKMYNHLKTVYKHRKYVRQYCYMAKLYWQGLTHDLSKYSPVELFESIKYYQGTRSPIDACKEANEYSKAWLHHRGRNKHHREYWTDYYDAGLKNIKMPYKYATEMLCDFLGAGEAYNKNFTYYSEYQWWKKQLEKGISIHPATANYILLVLKELSACKNEAQVRGIFNNLPWYYEMSNKTTPYNNILYQGNSLYFYKEGEE